MQTSERRLYSQRSPWAQKECSTGRWRAVSSHVSEEGAAGAVDQLRVAHDELQDVHQVRRGASLLMERLAQVLDPPRDARHVTLHCANEPRDRINIESGANYPLDQRHARETVLQILHQGLSATACPTQFEGYGRIHCYL